MICKYCQAVLEDGTAVCPNCGEVLAEKPKKTPLAAWLAVGLCAVLLVALVVVVVLGINRGNADPDETRNTDPSETVGATGSAQTELADPSEFLLNVDIAGKASYTVSADALDASADTVVATAGAYTLTNEQLRAFYWMQFNDFMEYYSYYAYYYFGLDSTLPLDSQYVPNSTVTWEQYFLDGAISTWHQCIVLGQMAQDEGFVLDQEMRDSLDSLAEDLQTQATENGYADAEALLAEGVGPGCTVEAYCYYMDTYWTALSYSETLYNQFAPTEDEIKAYFDEHAAEFEASGITMDTAPYVDVRHILLMPATSGTDEAGSAISTDEDWAACYSEAQTILDTWQAGEATEESFAELANTHSEDGGSNTTGGLYEMVTDDGTYVPEFTAWAVDAARQIGDTGIVQTEYGYHIMYCSAIEEAWHLYARDELINSLANEKITAVEENHVLACELDKIALGGVPVAEEEPAATDAATATE